MTKLRGKFLGDASIITGDVPEPGRGNETFNAEKDHKCNVNMSYLTVASPCLDANRGILGFLAQDPSAGVAR